MSRNHIFLIGGIAAIAALVVLTRTSEEEAAHFVTPRSPGMAGDDTPSAGIAGDGLRGSERRDATTKPSAPATDPSDADARLAELEAEYGRAPVFDAALEEALRNPPDPVLPDNWDEILANPPKLPPDVERMLNDPPPVTHDPQTERILREQPDVEIPPEVRALMNDPTPVPPPPAP